MSSTEERNAKDDLALCDKATPGPWIVMPEKCGPDGQTVYQEESLGPICDVGDPYPRGGNHPTENMHFIAMAREALPYWIERAQKLERALRLACEECDGESHVRGCLMFGDPE